MPQHHRAIFYNPFRAPPSAEIAWTPFDSQCEEKAFGLVAILRSSRQLYDEVSNQLYRRDLCFKYNISWGWGRIWTVVDLPSLCPYFPKILPYPWNNFKFANFARFHKIVFEISCPRKDSSQYIVDFVRLFHGLGTIIRRISDITQCFVDVPPEHASPYPPRSARLPRVEIIFLEVDPAKSSIAGLHSQSTEDFERCLEYFAHLRRSAGVTIKLPETIHGDEHLAELVENVKGQMMADKSSIPTDDQATDPMKYIRQGKPTSKEELIRRAWYLRTLREMVRPDVRAQSAVPGSR